MKDHEKRTENDRIKKIDTYSQRYSFVLDLGMGIKDP